MKNYFSNRNEIARVSTIFAMILAMVAIAYYYLINLTTDLRWVMMCGYIFAAIPAFFTLLHGAVAKRSDVLFLGVEFVVLGIFGFVAKLFHGLNHFTLYNYFFSAAYALSTVFVFSFADKVAFGKRLFTKWWALAILIILSVLTSAAVYILPETPEIILRITIIVKNAAFILLNLLALAVGVCCIVKGKDKYFSWAYSIYVFFNLAAYIFQIFYLVRWYNLFLMFAVVAIPYVLMSAVKYRE